jgi:hypothetical protein
MALMFSSRLGAMVLRRAHMKMFTGSLTPFTSQITSPVYMEAMLSIRKMRKGGL